MQTESNEPGQAKAKVRVCVRLTQGSSACASWVLEESQVATALTIGSSPACDWTIKAAHVAPEALCLLLSAGEIYVRSSADDGVLLNGRALGRGWQRVPLGTRLDIGLARLEIVDSSALPPGSTEHEERGETTNVWLARGLETDDAETSGVRPSMSVMQRAAFLARDRLSNAPSVLGSRDSNMFSQGRGWLYALVAFLVGSVYFGWIVLLDQ